MSKEYIYVHGNILDLHLLVGTVELQMIESKSRWTEIQHPFTINPVDPEREK
jgi:hypothetical protein